MSTESVTPPLGFPGLPFGSDLTRLLHTALQRRRGLAPGLRARLRLHLARLGVHEACLGSWGGIGRNWSKWKPGSEPKILESAVQEASWPTQKVSATPPQL